MGIMSLSRLRCLPTSSVTMGTHRRLAEGAMTYVFADCELDTRLYTLRRGERVLRLRPKVFQVLTYLLTHRDRVVSKHELFEQVWPEQFISETALESCIKAARQALG